jgi:hypothetical protein
MLIICIADYLHASVFHSFPAHAPHKRCANRHLNSLLFDDLRGYEDKQLRLVVPRALLLKEPSDEGKVAEERNLLLGVAAIDGQDAADHRGLTVGEEDLCGGLVLADGRLAAGAQERSVRRVLGGLDLHEDLVVRRDMRGHGQAKKGVNELHLGSRGRCRLIGDRLPLFDLRLFVVECAHARRRNDLAFTRGLHGREYEVEVQGLVERAEGEPYRSA